MTDLSIAIIVKGICALSSSLFHSIQAWWVKAIKKHPSDNEVVVIHETAAKPEVTTTT
jgi:hypothetical protein